MFEELISLRKLQLLSWVYLLVLTVGSWLIFSWSFAWAVAAGGVISILSFLAIHKDVSYFFDSMVPVKEGEEPKGKGGHRKSRYIIRFWLRLGIIGLVLLLLIKSGRTNVFGLLVGLSTVVFTIIFTTVSIALHHFSKGR